MNSEIEDFFDWKGQKSRPKSHGGIRAASFTCFVEVLENMVFLCNATNFVSYFRMSMHYPPAEAANMVTNFMGTSFLLTIFGGFISDSYLTRFTTFVIFCSIEILGLIVMTIQSHSTKLLPAPKMTPLNSQEAILYTGLYAIAIGVGGVKASLPAHGADQLDHNNQRLISAFFNWFFFSLAFGGLLACTVMVWIEENKGWNWSFIISAVMLSVALCIFLSGFRVYRYKQPAGSPFTIIMKVFGSAVGNWRSAPPVALNQDAIEVSRVDLRSSNKFRFLDKALHDDRVSDADVEQTKTFLGLLPIFASTIMMSCCLAQLQTFTVQQGVAMDRTINNFKIPTQSLTVIPLTFMLLSIPFYERFAKVFGDKVNSKHNFFQPIKRIGLGLALASCSMAAAAAVEVKRRDAANQNVTISVFWLSFQYLLLGVSDMLTLGGMLEFFYSEAPDSMRSISTALPWCSTSFGYFLSSVLVTISNNVSGHFGKEWLVGDLNKGRLDLFYTLLCVLNFLNLLNYIYWAKRY
ncbi:hypothetical protein ACFE04_000492 [Oxalis oulophora]